MQSTKHERLGIMVRMAFGHGAVINRLNEITENGHFRHYFALKYAHAHMHAIPSLSGSTKI